MVGKGKTVELNLNVSPSNFTVSINYLLEINSRVKVEKQSNTKFLITGVKLGKATIRFVAKSSESTFILAFYDIIVDHIYIQSISVEKHITIRADSFYNLNLTVSPSNFTNDIEFSTYASDALVIKVERITVTKYKITGVGNGDATVFFRSERDDYGWFAEAWCDVTVISAVQQKKMLHYIGLFNKYACPSTSTANDPINILVIPVWFSDSGDYYAEADRDQMWFDIYHGFFGPEQYLEYESVKSFYEKESQGRVTISGTMSGWYQPGKKGKGTDKDDIKDFVKRSTKLFFEKYPEIDRKTFDHNGDGFIDCVSLIYAYPMGERGDALWGFKSSIFDATADKAKPNPRQFIWASYDFMKAKQVDKNKVNARTFIHEMGHIFGLKDYYDGSTKIDWSSSLNIQADGRGGHDPFSCMALGWAEPYIPTKSCTLRFNDFQSSGEFVILTPQWNMFDSPFDEYLVIELVGESGLNKFDMQNYFKLYDANYTGAHAGIRVYHIDSRLWNPTVSGYSSNAKVSTKFAFDNSYNAKAGYLSDDNICQLHMIRKDPNVYQTLDTNKINYYSGSGLVQDDLFYVGDTFNYNLYRNQFFKYYERRRMYVDEHQNGMEVMLHKYEIMNNGYKLNWSFKVERIISNLDGSFTAIITFTKS